MVSRASAIAHLIGSCSWSIIPILNFAHITTYHMAGFFSTPPTLHGTHLATVPAELYAEGTSDWSPGTYTSRGADSW